MGNEIIKTENGLRNFNGVITNAKTQEYLGQVLGDRKGAFIASLTSMVTNNKQLQSCEPLSLMYAALKATALQLPMDSNLGFAYVIPYRDNRSGKTEAQFQLGAKAFTQLAIRSGEFRTINVTDVREGEFNGIDIMTGELHPFNTIEHREKAPIVGYCAYMRLLNGFEKALYWTVDEVTEHARKYSLSFRLKGGVWSTNFDAMAEKTLLKRLLSKYAPLYVDKGGISDAIRSDQAVIKGENEYEYVDNQGGASSSIVEQALEEIEGAGSDKVSVNSDNVLVVSDEEGGKS